MEDVSHLICIIQDLSFITAAPRLDPQSSSTVIVGVGYPLTLSCTSRGSPPHTFTWRKDSGPKLLSTIAALTHTDTSAAFRADYSINSATKSDNGMYTCTVINPIGSNSETINVIVSKLYTMCYLHICTSIRKIL